MLSPDEQVAGSTLLILLNPVSQSPTSPSRLNKELSSELTFYTPPHTCICDLQSHPITELKNESYVHTDDSRKSFTSLNSEKLFEKYNEKQNQPSNKK